MAITFFQTKKRQKKLSLILAAAVIVFLIIMWQGFLKGGAPTTSLIAPLTVKKINIDWQILQSPQIADLQAFEETPPFEDEVGRDNPFIPY